MIDKVKTSRPRVLLMAFMCSPDHGSEWAVGWNRAIQCAKHFDTWVICQGDQQAVEVQRFLEINGPIPGLQFEFVPFRPGPKPATLGGLSWLAYGRWHRKAFTVARQLHAKMRFDLVHQVTNTGYREPGYLWKLDVPFVWGPVGGTQNYPWRFLSEAGLRFGLGEALRSLLNNVQLNWSRRGWLATRRARVVFAANSTIRSQFNRARGVDPALMLETGLPRVADVRREVRDPTQPLRILWSGQFIPCKALSLLLKALAQLPRDVPFELRVLGGGPLERRWKRQANQLGISKRIEWLGWQPYHRALEQYTWADVFAFTSLRDNSGNVVLEALANGVPVLCLDHQGVRDIVTTSCGRKIPVSTPRQVVKGLRDALVRFACEPEERAEMGNAAIDRARDFLWSRQGEQMTEVYRRILASSEASEDIRPLRSTPLVRPRLVRRRTRAQQHGPSRDPRFAAGRLSASSRSHIRRIITWGAGRAAAGLNALFGPQGDNGFGILMYHRVAPRDRGLAAPTWNVTPHQFRTQLQGLLARGFEAWPLTKLIEARRQRLRIPSNAFAVTFDDGYENNYQRAWPILRDLGIPATIFLATSYLNGSEPFPFDDWAGAGSKEVAPDSWRPLSTDQCQEMLDAGLIELGAHTHSHQKFVGRHNDFEDDLNQCVEVLQDSFGITNPTFAFPYGADSPELIDAAKRVGVACSLSTRPQRVVEHEDAFQWGRFTVEEDDTPTVLAAKLSGWYTTTANICKTLGQPFIPHSGNGVPRRSGTLLNQAAMTGNGEGNHDG
jgi:glycosyltransferase involved in cell wall biosynthesis/peptidoglycan/xylan/chitin deacetylase (PgdA/CDA1 family)